MDQESFDRAKVFIQYLLEQGTTLNPKDFEPPPLNEDGLPPYWVDNVDELTPEQKVELRSYLRSSKLPWAKALYRLLA